MGLSLGKAHEYQFLIVDLLGGAYAKDASQRGLAIHQPGD